MTKLADVKLSESFLEQYQNKQPKWGFGGLGYIVYLRTYARKTFGGNVLERWDRDGTTYQRRQLPYRSETSSRDR
jgi:hypothetical protein